MAKLADATDLKFVGHYPVWVQFPPALLYNYIASLWKYADRGCKYSDTTIELHTYGWSGNEAIADALQDNTYFWTMFWEKSERGGHYYFRTKEGKI